MTGYLAEGVQKLFYLIREVFNPFLLRDMFILIRVQGLIIIGLFLGTEERSESCPLLELAHHELYHLMLIALFVDISSDSSERVVENGEEHVQEDVVHGNLLVMNIILY